MIKHLVAALADAGIEADAESIADALWLARACRGAGEENADADRGPVVRPLPTEPRPPDAEPGHPADDAGPVAGQATGLRLDRPETGSRAASGTGGQASPVTFRPARELPGALELGRVLRPLKRRHPSKRDLALDAEGTVAYFCDTGVLTPVMRPGDERWFDVDVLIDAGPSMAVWQDTGQELVALLERHGAFGDVRQWRLEQVDGKVRLSRAAGGRSEAPQLMNRGARRLTMIVTDCVDPMWYQAPVWDAIRQWGLTSPVVITALLPSRLWAQTALGSPEVTMRSHQAGSANAQLDVAVPWWWPDDAPPRSAVAVPVISLEAESVAAWARMVMGAGGVAAVGVFAAPPFTEPAVGPPTDQPGAEERVQRFRVTVSPTAYRLAVYLAAALRGSWGLALARVVQDAMLPGSGQVHLAEVIVGGLVRPADHSTGMYEFVEGVADILRRSLTATEALRVLQALGGHIERETGRSPGIAAMLLGEAPPADATVEFEGIRAGAADLIQAMGLARHEPVAGANADRPRAAITALVTLPDGRLVGGAADGQVVIWDLDAGSAATGPGSGTELGRHDAAVTALAVLPGGRMLSDAADGTIWTWDLTAAEPGRAANRTFEGLVTVRGSETVGDAVTAHTALPDGRLVLGTANGRIAIWDDSSAAPRAAIHFLDIEGERPVTALAALPDGWFACGTDDGRLRLIEPAPESTSPRTRDLRFYGEAISALSALPDGRLVSGTGDGQLQLWTYRSADATADRFLTTDEIGRHGAAVTALVTLPDGRLASGTRDGQVWLWDPGTTGSASGISELGRHDTSVTALAALPDGRLVSGTADGQLRVWGLIVGGPTQTADREPIPQSVLSRPQPQRFLVASCPRRVRDGTPLSMTVSVTTSPPTGTEAISAPLRDFDVAEGIDIAVTFQEQFGTGVQGDGTLHRKLRVPAAGDSDPVAFRLRTVGPGDVQLTVAAWADMDSLGALDFQVTVEDAGASAGEVTLAVRSDGELYTFQLLTRQRRLEPVAGRSRLSEASQISRQVLDVVKQSRGRERLKNLGTLLWDSIIPPAITDQFWSLQPDISSFIIDASSDFGSVLWELLYPQAPGRDAGFLAEQFPVTRLVHGHQWSPLIGADGVTPVLLSASSDAREEVAALEGIVGRPGDDAPVVDNLPALLDLLGSGQAKSLYFTGHGAAAANPDEPVITLKGGSFSPSSLAAVKRAQPGGGRLVFFNACRSAREQPESTHIEKWAQPFLATDAVAFVGTSWTVSSETARMFAEAFYQALSDGATLGQAASSGRRAASQASSDTDWLAYAVFGDPQQVADLALGARPEVPTAPSGKSHERAGAPRIVAVHGLGQQLRGKSELFSRWIPSLQDGLERAGAERVTDANVSVAFYGDLVRPVVDSDRQDAEQGLDEEMIIPLWRAAAPETNTPIPEPESGSGGGLMQRAVRALSASRFFSGLSEAALFGDLSELRRYLNEPAIRQAVLERLADTIGPETRVIVAHSTGSIAAYEALCAHPEWDIRMFVTLGSPLGWRYVFDRLVPPPQNGMGSWPGSTRQWTNVADKDDIVALEKRLAPRFAGPVKDVLVDNGARAHDLSPYLTAVETGRAIAAGLRE